MKSYIQIRIMLLILILSPLNARAEELFHPANSEPEKFIEKLLEYNMNDHGDFFFYLTGRSTSKNSTLHDRFITTEFHAAVISAEKQRVDEDCGGKYIEGDLCGIDIDPISCAQDTADYYIFHTLEETPQKTIISYRWPDTTSTAATYILKKINSDWKLDGVSCENYLKFNWSSDK